MSNNDDREHKARSCKGVPLKHDGKKVKIDRIGRVGKPGIFCSPERVKIIPRQIGCPFGQDNGHDSHIRNCDICMQTMRPNKPAIKHKNSQDAFLQFLWGPEAMITAINKRFVQCANGRIMDVKSHQEFKQAEWIAFHKGQLCMDEEGKWRDATGVWLASSSRARCMHVVFDPQRPSGLTNGVFNKVPRLCSQAKGRRNLRTSFGSIMLLERLRLSRSTGPVSLGQARCPIVRCRHSKSNRQRSRKDFRTSLHTWNVQGGHDSSDCRFQRRPMSHVQSYLTRALHQTKKRQSGPLSLSFNRNRFCGFCCIAKLKTPNKTSASNNLILATFFKKQEIVKR
jgi:hypothetical protein